MQIGTADDAMKEIAEKLLAWLRDHRDTCPETPDECLEPYNAIAWLAHRVGIGPEHAPLLSRLIEEYENHCPRSAHRRN